MVQTMSDWKASDLSALALAYIGDAVWELYARNHVLDSGIRRPKELHRAATKFVSARAQARLVSELWDVFTEKEQGVLRRGRNAKPGHSRKNADVLDYRHSTAFEALVGYLYGTEQHERLAEVFQMAVQRIDTWEE